jgi:hypothetical protein
LILGWSIRRHDQNDGDGQAETDGEGSDCAIQKPDFFVESLHDETPWRHRTCGMVRGGARGPEPWCFLLPVEDYAPACGNLSGKNQVFAVWSLSTVRAELPLQRSVRVFAEKEATGLEKFLEIFLVIELHA